MSLLDKQILQACNGGKHEKLHLLFWIIEQTQNSWASRVFKPFLRLKRKSTTAFGESMKLSSDVIVLSASRIATKGGVHTQYLDLSYSLLVDHKSVMEIGLFREYKYSFLLVVIIGCKSVWEMSLLTEVLRCKLVMIIAPFQELNHFLAIVFLRGKSMTIKRLLEECEYIFLLVALISCKLGIRIRSLENVQIVSRFIKAEPDHYDYKHFEAITLWKKCKKIQLGRVHFSILQFSFS